MHGECLYRAAAASGPVELRQALDSGTNSFSTSDDDDDDDESVCLLCYLKHCVVCSLSPGDALYPSLLAIFGHSGAFRDTVAPQRVFEQSIV